MAEASAFRPWAVIPAKRFNRAKSRLSHALTSDAHETLTRALFERVLDACTRNVELHGTLVVTDGDDVAALAARRGAHVLRDAPVLALALVIDAALATLPARGATHALVLMADLPRIQPRDVAELLARLRGHDLVIAPDAHRRGTSALGLRLDIALRTCFGHDDSLQRHLHAAARLGASCAVLHNPRIAFDVDTPEDLAVLRASPAPLDRNWRAARTNGKRSAAPHRSSTRARPAGLARSP
jgi:2-phospho-L-lactate guanylyltransferase